MTRGGCRARGWGGGGVWGRGGKGGRARVTVDSENREQNMEVMKGWKGVEEKNGKKWVKKVIRAIGEVG